MRSSKLVLKRSAYYIGFFEKQYFDYVSKDYSKNCYKGIDILKVYGLYSCTSWLLIIDYGDL